MNFVLTSAPLLVALSITPSGVQAAQAAASSLNAEPHEQEAADRRTTLFGTQTDLTIGAAASYGPRYFGADARRVRALPVLSVQRGVVFADTDRGAGLQYQFDHGLYVAQSIFYDFGRRDRNSAWLPGGNRLAGMGDVPGTATTRTLIVVPLTVRLSASVEAEFALRDSARRNRYRAGLEQSLFKTARDEAVMKLDLRWGDRRYNQAYFGVTPEQAARSGLAPFAADGGVHAWSASVAWNHHFDAHWTTTVQLSGTRYGHQVDRSPVLAQQATPNAIAAITYTF